MFVAVQFSFFLFGVAMVLFSVAIYRKRIKLPEGRPNDVAPAHFARYGLFLILLLLASALAGFYVSPSLPEPYGTFVVLFVAGIMTGAFGIVYAFPLFMIGLGIKEDKKVLKFGLTLLVAVLMAVATITIGSILFL